MTDVIQHTKQDLLKTSIHGKMMTTASNHQIRKMQRRSGCYAYRRVPMDTTALREKDAIKEKRKMLLESMKKQFNVEGNIENEIKIRNFLETSGEHPRKQTVMNKSCKSNACDTGDETVEVNRSDRSSKNDKNGEVVVDCHVKLFPLKRSLRTRREHQLSQSDLWNEEAATMTVDCKRLDSSDPPNKGEKTSGQCLHLQAVSPPTSINNLKGKPKVNKTKPVSCSAPSKTSKTHKISGRRVYSLWPQKVGASVTLNDSKAKNKILLESMKKHFNIEGSIEDEINNGSLLVKPGKYPQKQTGAKKSCKSNTNEIGNETLEMSRSEKRSRNDKKSEAEDCNVKLIPLKTSRRTRKEHQLAQTELMNGEASTMTINSKRVDDSDPPNKRQKTSGQCLQVVSPPTTANNLKGKHKNTGVSMKEQFNLQNPMEQSVTNEESKLQASDGRKGTRPVSSSASSIPPKIHQTSDGHIYCRWPQTAGAFVTMNDLKAKNEKILESMREQFNLETPKEQSATRVELDKLEAVEKKYQKINNNNDSGATVPPISKLNNSNTDIDNPIRLRGTRKRKVKGSCDVILKSRKSERISVVNRYST